MNNALIGSPLDAFVLDMASRRPPLRFHYDAFLVLAVTTFKCTLTEYPLVLFSASLHVSIGSLFVIPDVNVLS